MIDHNPYKVYPCDDCGQPSVSYIKGLSYFKHYCSRHYYAHGKVTDGWLKTREKALYGSQNWYIEAMRPKTLKESLTPKPRSTRKSNSNVSLFDINLKI